MHKIGIFSVILCTGLLFEAGIQAQITNSNSYTTISAEAPTSPPSTENQVSSPTIHADTIPAANPTSHPLSDGVFYQVLKEGSGGSPATTQSLLLHYTLYLTDGTKIESSRDLEVPLPLKLKLGQGDFIKGFEIGVKGMKTGEIRRIYVPSEVGYGSEAKGPLPPNTPLIFEVEQVGIK